MSDGEATATFQPGQGVSETRVSDLPEDVSRVNTDVSATNPSSGTEGLPDNIDNDVGAFINVTPQDNTGNTEDVTQEITVSVVVENDTIRGITNPTLYHDVNSNGTYTELDTEVSEVSNGTQLTATTTGLSPFAVAEATPTNPFPDGIPGVGSVPPADLDNDGKFEDVNGDGELTFDDAIALAFADTSRFTSQQVVAVDFDSDGDVDFDDAITLAPDASTANPFPDGIPGVGSVPPADLDNDGKFEDINGDGELTFDDAIALAFADTSRFTSQQVVAVDFDSDGDVDFDDAITLAFE